MTLAAKSNKKLVNHKFCNSVLFLDAFSFEMRKMDRCNYNDFYFQVDIRDLKRMKRFGALENSDLSTCLSNENKTIVNHLLEKLGQVEEDDSTGKIKVK